MSKIDKNVWFDAVVTSGIGSFAAVAVAGVIRKYYNNETGAAWPSLQRMADNLGVSRASIQRAVKALEEKGYLSHTRGAEGRSNRYRLTIPASDEFESEALDEVYDYTPEPGESIEDGV
jgi:biotin operon repressor